MSLESAHRVPDRSMCSNSPRHHRGDNQLDNTRTVIGDQQLDRQETRDGSVV